MRRPPASTSARFRAADRLWRRGRRFASIAWLDAYVRRLRVAERRAAAVLVIPGGSLLAYVCTHTREGHA